MTVKIILALRQKANVSIDVFQKKCKEERGPLIASLQTSLRLVKYVQNHRQCDKSDDELRSVRPNLISSESPFDVIEEFCIDDTDDGFARSFRSQREVWKVLRDACADFLDYSTSFFVLVEERTLILPGSPDMIMASEYNSINKAVAFAVSSTNSNGAQYWMRSHSTTTQRWGPALGLKKYAQNVPYDHDVLNELSEGFGTVRPRYDICATMWFDGNAQFGNAYVKALAAIREDEDSGFLTPKSMTTSLVKEHIFVDKYRTW
ncbi:uncharacterized protein Z519_08598 [Cladophialophora bantiana CBS 173.52]|uniref:EthD domain-containing protein n=1 Tax=Cladophialophora bantiana (strain ATCC 10958 / CBS 173.52 / CDC B-1940 / NIH 8579) TaxID=1442370 RepID=A0A0D2HJ67_CLAB1|nr:uncharacterized protein Z519_08598 [Cladophialophora bantiana CBS 173.52]KIW90815.1 hypothetical protein Z519_08598 [Cladophialophora bantiana CBS 173.52]